MSQRTVWKYTVSVDPLAVMGTQIIEIPAAACLIHCAPQHDTIALWYEVPAHADKPLMERHGFQIFGTGHGPIGSNLTYVGTAIFANGDLVLHVYEVIYL